MEFFGREVCEKYTKYTKTASQICEEIKLIRKQGYSLVNQELELGMCSLAVPVYDRSKNLKLALIVSCNAWSITTDEMLERILPVLKKASREITHVLP